MINIQEEEEARDWLVPDSPAHKAIKKTILENKQLLKDMKKLNENLYTTHLEVFHALKGN